MDVTKGQRKRDLEWTWDEGKHWMGGLGRTVQVSSKGPRLRLIRRKEGASAQRLMMEREEENLLPSYRRKGERERGTEKEGR